MSGYFYSPKAVECWDWPAQATYYQQVAQHEASRARYWQRRYESLATTEQTS